MDLFIIMLWRTGPFGQLRLLYTPERVIAQPADEGLAAFFRRRRSQFRA